MEINNKLYNTLLYNTLIYYTETDKKNAKLLKKFSANKQHDIIDYINQVHHNLYDILYHEYEKAYENPKYPIIDFKEYIGKEYPWISSKNIRIISNQVRVQAWREGLVPDAKTSKTENTLVKLCLFFLECIVVFILLFLIGAIISFFKK